MTKQIVYPIARVFLLSAVLWTFRLGHESLSSVPQFLDTLWLTVLRPMVLAGLGTLVAVHYILLRENNDNRSFWSLSFISGGILCLPYFPDMYASFLKAGEAKALPLALAFFALGILTYGGMRGLVTNLSKKYLLAKIQSLPIKSFTLYAGFLLSEFFFFHSWHPITYFPALPIPLPASRLQTTPNANPKNKKIQLLLFESYMDQQTRSQIAQGSDIALSILGEKLAQLSAEQIAPQSLDQEVIVVLPETFVSLQDKSQIKNLSEPLFRTLIKKHNLKRMAWIQGAFVNDANLILGAEWSTNGEELSSSEIFVLRAKKEHMPMFEAPSKGISYSSIPENQPPEEESPPPSHPLLHQFINNSRLLICYESLFPSNWRFGQQAVVLTNHHLFTEFHLMNWVYLGFIRQLSFVFGAPALLVSNYNPSGILMPSWPWRHSGNSFEKDWQVISYGSHKQQDLN